jgi:hypothetical protein
VSVRSAADPRITLAFGAGIDCVHEFIFDAMTKKLRALANTSGTTRF